MSDQSESYEALRTQLNDSMARRDWTELLDLSRRGAQQFPNAWEPPLNEARALLESGAYEPADHLLLLCMDRFPANPQFAVLYGHVGSRRLTREEACERWLAMRTRMSNAPALYVGLAQAYRAAGQLDTAERAIGEGLARWPDLLPLLIVRADLASQRKDWAAAVAGWGEVRARAPERMDALIAMVGALRQSERFDEADLLAEEGLQRSPQDAELLTSFAAVAVARQDWLEAVQRLRRLLEVAPDNAGAALGLSGALQRLERMTEAEMVMKEALARAPDNEMLLFEHARMAGRAKRWDFATQRWKAVFERCAPRAAIYLEYVNALQQNDQFTEADELASEAVGFAPRDLPLLVQHAKLATLRLDLEEAVLRWQAITDDFPNDEPAQEALEKARSDIKDEKKQARKDAQAKPYAPPGGSLSMPLRRTGMAHLPQVGPTALDLLLTGAPAGDMALPQPQPSGLAGLFSRMRQLLSRR